MTRHMTTIEQARAFSHGYVIEPFDPSRDLYTVVRGDGGTSDELRATGDDPVPAATAIRLQQYWSALDRYMDAGEPLESERYFYHCALRQWDGYCAVCDHDWLLDCHGDCTCLSCNAERQALEREQ